MEVDILFVSVCVEVEGMGGRSDGQKDILRPVSW